MAKGKGGGSFPNPKGHTGPKTQFPQARRPPAAVVPLACGKCTCDAETVKDPATGLPWQRLLPETYGCSGSAHVMGDLCRWNEAKSYCSKLVLGSGAWRLPTKDELLSIVDKRTSPSTDAVAFPDTPALWFWSATPYEENEYSAWSVHFYDGTPSYDDMRQQFLVPRNSDFRQRS